MGEIVRKIFLPIFASIMTTELDAIRLALGIINDTPYSNYVICSDSMSSVQSIDNYTENNHLLHRLVYQMHESILRGNHITISWVPSHVGICGNESADQAAREAAMRPAEFIPVPHRDWFPLIKEKLIIFGTNLGEPKAES